MTDFGSQFSFRKARAIFTLSLRLRESGRLRRTSLSSHAVIPSGAGVQAERGISRPSVVSQVRSLGPLVKNAGLRNDLAARKNFKLSHYRRRMRTRLHVKIDACSFYEPWDGSPALSTRPSRRSG